jgi:2-polyprenyl-3-methyl-5-hydroxy-6-metoxy-1,4-benzoquinol methylase
MKDQTIEPQYQGQVELRQEQGLTPLGIKTSHTWHIDPKRLLFSFARYKFVAKMLSGKGSVLEVGCGDAFCSRLVLQEVESLTATDMDPVFIADATDRADPKWPITVKVHNILDGPFEQRFDGAYSLDVIEHIPREHTETYIDNVCESLQAEGVFIVGTPSLNSQAYASENSQIGHVNCMNGPELKSVMERRFENVLVFSMNDEVVHTGYFAMAHYLFAVGSGVRPT